MKKALLYVILFFAFYNSYGQYYTWNYYLTFDSGSVFFEEGWGVDTTYYNDSVWINIDTINCHRNQWQIGRPQKTVFDSAYSYPNAIVTDTLHPCLPNDTSVFVMKAPIFYYGQFSFEYKLNIDSGDIAIIEISYDTGLHWINIITDTSVTFDFGGGPKPDLSVSTTGWESFNIYNLGSPLIWPVYSYLFRFTLITDSSAIPRDGWMMDNFYVGVEGEGVPIIQNNNHINLYPNPATTFITITSKNPIIQITVTNLLGQVLYTHNYNTEQVQIDIADLPQGVYFVKVNGVDVKKFVKE